jgi:hypothetical protein
MDTVGQTSNHGELLVAGTIKDAPRSDVDLVVVIERVVPDDEIPEILGLYGNRIRTDADGRFADRYTVPDDMRQHLHGWVMCTVVVQPQVPGAGSYVKVVRWQRPSSDELIAGLGALLSPVSFKLGVVTR